MTPRATSSGCSVPAYVGAATVVLTPATSASASAIARSVSASTASTVALA